MARDFGAAARRCSGVDAEIDLGPEGGAFVSLAGMERATAQRLVEAAHPGVSLFAGNAREHRRRNDRSETDTPWHYRDPFLAWT